MEALFRIYYKSLCLYCTELTGDYMSSEDIVQEVMVRLWQQQSLQSIIRPRAWLYVAVRNAAYDYIAKKETHRKRSGFWAYQQKDEFVSTHELAMIKAETWRQLQDKMQELPVHCRKIMHLHFEEGYSLKEIGVMLGLHSSTVKTQKARGLRYLRQAFGFLFLGVSLIFIIFF